MPSTLSIVMPVRSVSRIAPIVDCSSQLQCCLRARWRRASLTRAVAQARLSLDQRPVAHFLHIGKTAGTAVNVALMASSGYGEVPAREAPAPDRSARWYRRPITTSSVCGIRSTGTSVVFSTESGRARPAIFIPWNKGEAKAFARFDSPDALAVSLSAGGAEQQDAEAAMRAIQHVRSSYWEWFRDPDYFKSRADHILWIGRQESSGPEAARREPRPGEAGTADRPPASEQDRRPEARVVRSCPTEPSGMVCQGLFVSRTLRRVGSLSRLARLRTAENWSNLRGSGHERAAVRSSQCRRLPIWRGWHERRSTASAAGFVLTFPCDCPTDTPPDGSSGAERVPVSLDEQCIAFGHQLGASCRRSSRCRAGARSGSRRVSVRSRTARSRASSTR